MWKKHTFITLLVIFVGFRHTAFYLDLTSGDYSPMMPEYSRE